MLSWYQRNKEHASKRAHDYYVRHQEHLIEKARQHYIDNRESIREYAKRKHKETYVPIPPELHKPRGVVMEDGMRSGFERTLAAQLKKAGMSFEYETLKVPYILEGTYNPDFILANGIIIEAKGVLDQACRRKMIAVKKQNPDLDVRFVFMRASNLVTKNSKTTYGMWAEKHGFPWADGLIPQEWFTSQLT